ncbi:hypothetical protein ABFS83_04G179400 [Erythranthe nasuta]
MAYAAAISLKSTIKQLINSPRVSIVPKSLEIIEYLCNHHIPVLQIVLRKLDENIHAANMKSVNALDRRIREAIHEFEDVLDSHVSGQFLSQEEDDHNPRPLLFFLDLHEIYNVIGNFMDTLKAMMEVYLNELQNPSPEEDDDDGICPSRIDFGESSEMVGLSELFSDVKARITREGSLPEHMTISLIGMAGIGKTTLAKKLLNDPFILSRFKKRVFVTIGPQYTLERVLSDILRQVKTTREVDDDKMIVLMGEEGKLAALKGLIIKGLEDCRYLVVLDDLWDIKLWYRELAELFIWRGDDSRVMLTTRIGDVASISADWGFNYRMRFMDKKESWDLFRRKVFGDQQESLPYELEKAGKKIAENCAGLPLTIVTVANIMSKVDKTTEYWTEVAGDKRHSVFLNAYDQMLEVLYPSYDYLPQHLKPSFLYMGVFPQNNENLLQLLDLWFAEEFVESGNFAYRSFEAILTRSLLLTTHALHPSFWHMCNKEASKSKFFHALNTQLDVLTEGIKSQRRLCIQNNILFGIKDVCDSMTSISTVRSLLCTGPYHQYPVPVCLENFRLLRILHALTIRFYEFPIELLVKLVRLRYLALVCDENLPASISKLWNLEVLIVNRHLCIVKSSKNSSYMPMEIWDMKQLTDIQITGRNLQHPRDGSVLPNLTTLLGVGPQSCTKDVFERIPDLLKLGIRIELAPGATHEPFCFFDHISHLHKLQLLKCVIVNPILQIKIPTHLPIFPSTLIDLTLSGLGYPWEDTSMISSLPNLKILKLQCYAFRGPKWQVHKNEFRQLEMLQIDDTDLVNWTVEDYQCLDKLTWLGIRHCYKLDKIPHAFGEELRNIEIVDCNHHAMASAKQLKKDLDGKYNCRRLPIYLTIHSTWDI